ncbi:hypothetical protein [Salimicrobium album]|uniref:Uncharacterized protein n=1 Tax=Salimicrobium album TaxID=50717 RepID=A0A1H3GDB2_9BACI|nr:hypothetical protein [Salimicrobium album]SDY01040.1 hypothetical protein SAMN04488081_1886 [Salimicrobium album]
MKKLLLVTVVGLSLTVSVIAGGSAESEIKAEEKHPKPDVTLV